MARVRATKHLTFGSVLVFAVGLAGSARADWVRFSGTHAIKFSFNGVIKEVTASGTGVAVPNGGAPGGGAGGALKTLALTRPFARITMTTFATGSGVNEIQFKGIRINPKRAGPKGFPGVFAPIFTAAKGMTLLTRGTLPASGMIKLCNFTGCGASVVVNLTQTNMGVAIGPGVGGISVGGMAKRTGTFMATGMSGTMTGLTMVTVMGHPWTVNATAVSYRTAMGGVGTFKSTGAAHGPLGKAGTTLNVTSMGMGGTLQLVSGIQTTCAGCAGNNTSSGQITRLTLNFAPEPGRLVLLGTGAAGLAALGRRRTRR
jgi:hypothetical protein